MLEQAAREWPVDISKSFLIGDKDDDVAAAASFNIRAIKFNSAQQSLPDLVRQELARRASSQDRHRS
jgi:histidinol phosphatase-like enzyme